MFTIIIDRSRARALGERERDRQTDRQTDRERQRQTDRQTDTQRWGERETDRQPERQRQTDSVIERERERETDTDRQTGGDRQRQREREGGEEEEGDDEGRGKQNTLVTPEEIQLSETSLFSLRGFSLGKQVVFCFGSSPAGKHPTICSFSARPNWPPWAGPNRWALQEPDSGER